MRLLRIKTDKNKGLKYIMFKNKKLYLDYSNKNINDDNVIKILKKLTKKKRKRNINKKYIKKNIKNLITENIGTKLSSGINQPNLNLFQQLKSEYDNQKTNLKEEIKNLTEKVKDVEKNKIIQNKDGTYIFNDKIYNSKEEIKNFINEQSENTKKKIIENNDDITFLNNIISNKQANNFLNSSNYSYNTDNILEDYDSKENIKNDKIILNESIIEEEKEQEKNINNNLYNSLINEINDDVDKRLNNIQFEKLKNGKIKSSRDNFNKLKLEFKNEIPILKSETNNINTFINKIKDEKFNIYLQNDKNKLLKYQQLGNGINKNNDEALTTQDINNIMFPFNYYIGCFSNDQIDKIIKYIKKNDLSKFCFILNTLNYKDNKKIGHWVSIYGDLTDEYTLEYYDSFGNEPNKELKRKLKNLIADLQPDYYLKFKINKQKEQGNNNFLCGYFAIKFLIERLNNISFKEATKYKTIKENENDIEEFKDFYKKFKFI